MPLSNFPHGFAKGVTIRGIPIQVAHPGKVFWVNNSGVLADLGIGPSDGNDGTYLRPFSTVNYAISQCLAGRGDIICVMPGHSEALTSTSLNVSKAGVAILGLGEGNLRPLFTCAATTSTFKISAASCSVKNIQVKATINAVVAGFTLTAAASGTTLDVETFDTSSSVEFVSPIVTTSAANNLWINWRHRGYSNGSSMTRGIDLIGCQDAKLNIDFYGKASTAVVSLRTTASKNVMVNGRFYNASAALSKNVTDTASSTWSVDGYDAFGGNYFTGGDSSGISYLSTLSSPLCLESTVSSLTSGANTLFTITGGPIKVLEVVGIVTTNVQAQATSCKLQAVTTSPAATVDMNAAAVDLTGIAAGTSLRSINTTSILTPVTAGFVMEGNAFATQDTPFLVPAGTIQLNNASATNTGAIKWYLRYVPLSQNCRVVG